MNYQKLYTQFTFKFYLIIKLFVRLITFYPLKLTYPTDNFLGYEKLVECKAF